jgi:integrase
MLYIYDKDDIFPKRIPFAFAIECIVCWTRHGVPVWGYRFVDESRKTVWEDTRRAIVEGQSTVHRKAHDYAKKADVKVIKLHEFRHSCVSNLLMHGISPRLVARWVGDTESMVLSTYSHLLPSEKQDMAELMNKIVVDG